MDKLIEIFKNNFELEAIDIKEYSNIKVGPMKFNIQCFDIKGVGRLSFMQGKALFGLMKMDTIILTAVKKDIPLINYDRIKSFGSDVLIIDAYNTCDTLKQYPNLLAIKNTIANLDKYELKPNWYDSLRMEESIAVKSKKSEILDTAAINYFTEVASIINTADSIEIDKKSALQASYVNGLLENGGASTNMFVKHIGSDKTKELYNNYLFGVK